MTTRTAAYLCAATLILAGCGQTAVEQAAERAIERDTGEQADVDMRDDGSLRVNAKDGTVEIGRGATLPSDWPTEIGTYPGATITTSAAVTDDSGQPATMITLTSTDSAQAIVDFFQKKVTTQGWTTTAEATVGAMKIFSASKDGRNFAVQVVTSDDSTTATLVVSQEQ